jgi:hypothetical protein
LFKYLKLISKKPPPNGPPNSQAYRHNQVLLISDDLSKPKRRYDTNHEYISTQIICEFIKFNTAADGIRFNSSLYKNGRNLVIFNDDQINCQAVSLKTVKAVDFKIDTISCSIELNKLTNKLC